MSFTGFPVAALDFYDDLEMDNTKSFWEAHKAVWKDSVEAPMKSLVAELEPEFGPAKVFRPYRDVRFAKDKTPYKTHQGAYVAAAPSTGWYVEISARGTRVGAGFYDADGPRLLAAKDADRRALAGTALEMAREVSSLHVLFPLENEARELQARGLLLRKDCQFHWHNRGYANFDDFLGQFTAEKRKKAKRERRRVAEAGITFQYLTGGDISDAQPEPMNQGFRHRRENAAKGR